MKTLHRITFRAGCLFAAVPAIALLAFGRPVDGFYGGYIALGLPAIACFALAWVIKPPLQK